LRLALQLILQVLLQLMIELEKHSRPRWPTQKQQFLGCAAVFILLKSQAKEYFSLICCERKNYTTPGKFKFFVTSSFADRPWHLYSVPKREKTCNLI
jgi:hypothetical protein